MAYAFAAGGSSNKPVTQNQTNPKPLSGYHSVAGGLFTVTGRPINDSTMLRTEGIVDNHGMMISNVGSAFNYDQLMNSSNHLKSVMSSGFLFGGTSQASTTSSQFDWTAVDTHAAAQGTNQEVDGREILHFSGFKLVPPPPHAPPRSTREKPPGCKTVFIGGLPETVSEQMISELMQTCGNVETVRLGKKNFAHIRFDCYEAVDKAIFYSGWRMKIGEKDDKPNTGRIHCDYATARDDQYEYECTQRALERELRHKQRMVEDMNRPPSPPEIVRYSEAEASNITEMLKSAQSFTEASNTLTRWLDKGFVSGRNANRFYTMLHCVHSAVRRLMVEKTEFEEELSKYKEQYQRKMSGLLKQMETITTVYSKARQQKVWDHFTKPQRKNVEAWTRQCQEMKQKQDEELLANREEDEMELSDAEDQPYQPIAKKIRSDTYGQMDNLKDENDSLKCEIEAYKNELDVIRQEHSAELLQKSKQISLMQQTLRGMQEQLVAAQRELEEKSSRPAANDTTIGSGSPESSNQRASNSKHEDGHAYDKTSGCTESKELSLRSTYTHHGLRIIVLSSMFLYLHPRGAPFESVMSYLNGINIPSSSSELSSLLEDNPLLFQASYKNKEIVKTSTQSDKAIWKFVGFSKSPSL